MSVLRFIQIYQPFWPGKKATRSVCMRTHLLDYLEICFVMKEHVWARQGLDPGLVSQSHGSPAAKMGWFKSLDTDKSNTLPLDDYILQRYTINHILALNIWHMIKPEGVRQRHLTCFDLVCNLSLELYHFKELVAIQNVFPVFLSHVHHKHLGVMIILWWCHYDVIVKCHPAMLVIIVWQNFQKWKHKRSCMLSENFGRIERSKHAYDSLVLSAYCFCPFVDVCRLPFFSHFKPACKGCPVK